jgi:hypothetical protein
MYQYLLHFCSWSIVPDSPNIRKRTAPDIRVSSIA